jgi:SanA protein
MTGDDRTWKDSAGLRQNVPKRTARWRERRRRFIKSTGWILALFVAWLIWVQVSVRIFSEGKTFDQVNDVPGTQVGLVFGCDDKFQGRDNLYFVYRIEAAAALWHAGKLQCLIVSGDNRSKQYNEPLKMKQALVAKGVPIEKIVCDYAGLRTLDSVVRCKKVFGVDHFVVISQKFQNERAICIGRAHDIMVFGFNARVV